MTDNWKVEQGDCRDIMRTLPDNSVDAIVSDPPYGLSFMGKEWDHGVPGVEFWTEALRVAKPGTHLVAFGGTRTFHRLAVAIEDAGWEVRDCLSYLYGSGFPKSLAVDKAIDKMDAAEEQMARRYRFTAWVREVGLTSKQIDEATGTNMGGHYTTAASQPAIMTLEHLNAVRHLIGEVPEWVERECAIRSVESKNYAEREVVGQDGRKANSSWLGTQDGKESKWGIGDWDITAPATDAAKRWHGWGTALKPGWEPCILARKPLTGTVAANVTQYGTGAINVDGCRIGTDMVRSSGTTGMDARRFAQGTRPQDYEARQEPSVHTGRWPANVLLDEDAAGLLGEPSRFFYTAKASTKERWGILKCNCKATTIPVWENADQNHDVLTDATSQRKDTFGAISMDASGCNTPSSGNESLAQSRTDGKSTTSTGTSKTTDLRTCDSSAQPNISGYTADANCVTGFGGSRANSVANENQSLPSIGISAGKVGPSTGDVGPVTSLRSYTTSACENCGASFRVESHPTQKPIALMRWLCRLVTPPNGLILDPFNGSGSTGCAAVLEGFRYLGCELEAEYVEIARRRIAYWDTQKAEPDLFDA